MKRDLKENHDIEKVRLLDGTFKDFYQGVKKDAGRVQEELIQNKESHKPDKATRITDKEADKRVSILKEKKAIKEFNKRKITI
jgi:L-lactate utilization protein LutC